MSSLNKLAIRGIRSFDDKQISVIEFFSPVTVIVGHNGSGKTTIIECLKYATTGDQPPNTRGGAFIHDPKMANEKEVKAQVKLRFNSANGTRMLAVRNLSVTVKKTGLTMKTLESILALADANSEKGGKRSAISTKCAEMDQEIPQLLGVSKAVLENVIFCHQEDSYWPLSEPSTLKKKFDDIFEATKYTKALDSIKSLRKDRVAELKAEKERLEGLAREKQHADKLRSRIVALGDDIAQKQVEYEETKERYDELAKANQKFSDSASSFRNIYNQLEQYEANIKRLKEDLEETKSSMQERSESDQELQAKLNNSDENSRAQREKLRSQRSKAHGLEQNLNETRQKQTQLAQQLGAFKAEHEAQQERIAERERLIHATSDKYRIKGFTHSGLNAENIIQFTSKLDDVFEKQKKTALSLQADSNAESEAYNRKHGELTSAVQAHKAQRQLLHNQLSKAQTFVREHEEKLESMQTIMADVNSLRGDIEEKQNRLSKAKADVESAKYDDKIQEKTNIVKTLEEQRDALNSEFKTLNMQSDSRARLKHLQVDVKNKTAEIANTITSASAAYRRLVGGGEADANTIEREVNRVLEERERELSETELDSTTVNNELQQQHSVLSNLKQQLKEKKEQLKAMEKKIVDGLEHPAKDIDDQIEEARGELAYRISTANAAKSGTQIYESILQDSKRKKACTTCNRHLEDHEMPEFERNLKDRIRRANVTTVSDLQAEVSEWESLVKELQDMKPHLMLRDTLRDREVPALEAKVKELDAKIPKSVSKADEFTEKMTDQKREINGLRGLKTHAQTVSRLQQEIKKANDEIATVEEQLSFTGSLKTIDDVQNELEELSEKIRKNEKQKEAVMKEKETQNSAIRALENTIHKMEMNAVNLEGKLREKESLETQIEKNKQEIQTNSALIKDVDTKIMDAGGPIEGLRSEHELAQKDLQAQISDAQTLFQELRASIDRLKQTNKGIENYARGRRDQLWQEAEVEATTLRDAIDTQDGQLNTAREAIGKLEKDISAQGAEEAIIRENLRVRKMIRDIQKEEEKMSQLDIEGAARAKRQFNEKYGPSKEKETELQTRYSHLAGELNSQRSQLKGLEADLKDFKEVNRKYTDQLIKVKMSDMANNDLEKYAKALDNAIMKYHSLKMDEVNETMKHLWNKTYQGSDIDGIRIASDVEGGASKRSYNYRVVMNKDQVEMDMRGRCSAGQKMLASIIIRLALSDSFGQNCGILALDEPTNALDTENIDALASSLVDIIKERKNHANFQLIIITHDENFLRQLGQSDVMEYYWRVSRDSRQKSVIERQRFR